MSNATETLRVRSDGNIKFGALGMSLREEKVGEVLLLLAMLRIARGYVKSDPSK